MKTKKLSKTEAVANGMFQLGTLIVAIGFWFIIIIIILNYAVPNFGNVEINPNVFSIWLASTFIIGPYFFYVGLYFKYLHFRLSTFVKPIGLTLPIVGLIYFAQFLIEPELNKYFPFVSFDLLENITVELLGGLFTAWIFYFGFELYREEEQEKEHKQLLSELKSIRKELEILKQQAQQPIEIQSPAPNFITRLIQRFQKG